MKKTVLYLTYLTYIVFGTGINSPCDGDNWIAYKDEKCFKLVKNYTSLDQVEEICGQLGLLTDSSAPTLASIESAAEQEFLINVFNFSDSKITENGILCQKVQSWSFKHLQQSILDSRKEIQDLKSITNQLTTELNESKAKLKDLENNPIPIGFIYVQLPDQPEPYLLWGTLYWIDVTHDYAGLFFRVLGGDSEQFGVLQEDQSPRVVRVGTAGMNTGSVDTTILANGAWSAGTSAGAYSSATTPHWGLRFVVSSGEVRPRNKAVRIWKRTY